MSDSVRLRVNGREITVPIGSVVAAAVERAGIAGPRKSVNGEKRGPLCGMGICMECRVTINGRPHQRGCETLCEPGMEVLTDE
jgi:sarcosine oxidase subunit alpha